MCVAIEVESFEAGSLDLVLFILNGQCGVFYGVNAVINRMFFQGAKKQGD